VHQPRLETPEKYYSPSSKKQGLKKPKATSNNLMSSSQETPSSKYRNKVECSPPKENEEK